VKDKDLAEIITALEQKGIGVEIASTGVGTFKGLDGGEFHANMSLNDALAAAGGFEALILPGGKDSEKLSRIREAVQLVGLFNEQGRIIASVCDGCGLMLRGVEPHGKRIAAQEKDFENIWGVQATYENQPVVVDGNLITSNGEDLKAFADEVAKHVG
jgi:protease I